MAFKNTLGNGGNFVDLNKMLPLAAEYSDIDFLNAFLTDQQHFEFAKKSIVKAVRRANNRASNDITIALIPLLAKLCGRTEKKHTDVRKNRNVARGYL